MKRFKCIISMTLLFSFYVCAAELNWDWIQLAKNKTTNSVIKPTLKNFLERELPNFKVDFGFERKHKKNTLSEALLATLGGPQNPTLSPNDHTIILSACRSRSCDEKGFYWADSNTKTSMMGIIHYVFEGYFDKGPQLFLASKKISCNSLDKEAAIQLKIWLAKEAVTPSKVRCLESGKVVEIHL